MTHAEKMLDIKEFARQSHYSERQVRQYCIDGKIKGALKLTDDARKWLIPASAVQKPAERGAQAVEKRIDPLVEEAQKEHLAEVRSLIEEWGGSLYTTPIEEAVPGYHHPISDVQTNHLFEHLKEHLPSSTLWINYTIWSDRIDSYLFRCAELMRDVWRDHQLWADEYPTDSGELVWVNTNNYAYHEPIVKRISSKALDNQDNKHRIDFLVFDDQDEHESLDEVRASYTKTWVMYVDGTPVGQCIDKKVATETYEAASDYHLNNAEHVIILFRELKSLEDKIRQDIVEALAYQDYRWYTCQFCKNYHFPDLKRQRWSQWTEQSMYTALVDAHFKSLIPASKDLIARLKILVSFREQWIDRGVPKIEGNIVDGCFLINPSNREDWVQVHRCQFPNPLDNSQRLDIHKPMDSLQAHCLLEHFHKQFPKLNPYDSWRDLNFDNLHPTLLRKICSWLENEEFRQYGCYVCWLLKEKFSL